MSQLTKDEQRNLLLLARKTIENRLFGQSQLNPNLNYPVFRQIKGAFVTIHKKKYLRGCIGIIEALHPLQELIERLSISSAFQDPRFNSLSKEEYPDIEIEISVLSEAYNIQSVEEIVVGKHGLIISHQNKKGLLLPQVATDNHWDRETFLKHTCIKAHLPEDMWKKGAYIEVFEAEVFGEDDFK